MNDCSDCIYLTVDQDTDGYGREIASPDIYCEKGHTIGTVCCKEYISGIRMTEKQFTFNKDTVATNLKTPITYNNKTMSIGEVLEKLNELANENEDLKFQLDECTNHKLFSRRQLEQENKQLKETIAKLKSLNGEMNE